MALCTVALITQQNPPDDPDRPLLAHSLAERGIEALDVAWTEPFDFARAALTVVRSPWDYHLNRGKFVAWAKTVPRLHNSARCIEWSSDKRYLQQLEQRGFPVIPTEYLSAQKRLPLSELLVARAWPEAVVKPCVSGGAWRTLRFSEQNLAQAEELLAVILQSGEAMVQPYLPSVEGSGERGLIYLDSAFSHAVRRFAVLSTGTNGGAGCTAEPDERALAEKILSSFDDTFLYARVDFARDAQGALQLMELELIEPHLYLATAPGSADRLADAIFRRVN